MIDGVPAMMGLIHGLMAQGNWHVPPGTNWLDGGAPFYRCYRCADGRDVAVGALEPQFYALLLEGLCLSDAVLPDQNDRGSWPDMTARFADIFARHTRDHWAEVFAGTDACVAPVLSVDEAVKDAHLAPRGTYVDVGGVRQAAPAPRFSNAPNGPVPVPTAPGAQTDAILGELGYDAAAIRALHDGGVCT